MFIGSSPCSDAVGEKNVHVTFAVWVVNKHVS